MKGKVKILSEEAEQALDSLIPAFMGLLGLVAGVAVVLLMAHFSIKTVVIAAVILLVGPGKLLVKRALRQSPKAKEAEEAIQRRNAEKAEKRENEKQLEAEKPDLDRIAQEIEERMPIQKPRHL